MPNETSDSEFHSDMEPVKPKVKMGLQDTEVREGEKVRLDCVIAGQPEPEVSNLKNHFSSLVCLKLIIVNTHVFAVSY